MSIYKNITYSVAGYARLSNVEFVDMAQYGYTDAHDPRFSLAWVGTGPVTEIKPSYLKKCAFNRNFGTAVGLFGANGIAVDDNVIYSTVGEGKSHISANV